MYKQCPRYLSNLLKNKKMEYFNITKLRWRVCNANTWKEIWGRCKCPMYQKDRRKCLFKPKKTEKGNVHIPTQGYNVK